MRSEYVCHNFALRVTTCARKVILAAVGDPPGDADKFVIVLKLMIY
jgi:hypothetical protein